MHSPLAGWRVSLHRTRADWPIVAAAWLITLLAATLLAAGPIYSSAVSLAGLHRTLADAPVTEANVEVSTRVAPADVEAMDAAIRPELDRLIAPLGGSVLISGESDTFALPDQPEGTVRDLAVFGFADGLADHASLVAGSWPVTRPTASAPMQVAVLDAAAESLGLAPGSRLRLQSRLDAALVLGVEVAGIYTIDDPADPFWWNDPQLLTGLTESENYRTFGPFMAISEEMLARAAGSSVRLSWHALPDYEQLTTDSTGPLRARLEELPARISIATGGASLSIRTSLPQILADAERSLLVARTGVLLLMAQLAILAAYAIVLTAALLVDHRRIETALLRSRGAGAAQVAGMALAEGLVLAVPAVLLGPWLAVAALRLLNLGGPLADVGLEIDPLVGTDGYLAAGLAGTACVALLVLPALVAARSFAAAQGELSRTETRTFGQRLGLDVALLAVTAIGLWQLRLYGAPLTHSVQGGLGLDPLLVAAPAIGLLAGGVLALRILPLLAHAAEVIVSGGRDLVGSLGTRQLARRPLRYTRSALLLMLAMSMGVFALSYAATWTRSQRDQAAYQVGADVRVTPNRSLTALPAWALPGAYASLADAAAITPVERHAIRISRSARAGEVLALDAATAAQVVRFRSDEAPTPLAPMFDELRGGRPEPSLVEIPDGASALRVEADVEIRGLLGPVPDPATGQFGFGEIDPATLAGRPVVGATATILDGRGLLYRVTADPVPLAAGGEELLLVLTQAPARSLEAAGAAGADLLGPIRLASLSLVVSLPLGTASGDATLGIASVSAGTAPGGPWRALDTASAGPWAARWSQGGIAPIQIPSAQVSGLSMELAGTGTFGMLQGVDRYGTGWDISFTPSSVLALANRTVPAVVNRAFLAATASGVGEVVSAGIDGGFRNLQIVGVVDSFPTTAPGDPLILVDAPTLGLLRLQAANGVQAPDEWWMASAGGDAVALGAALSEPPFAGSTVMTLPARTSSLSADPVALGIIGALTLGFVAAGLFAVVGLTVSAAVSARQRRTEFALLRALGLSAGQLSGWLWLENASLVIVSMLAGTTLGLIIGWVVLPFVTVTQSASAPVPSVLVLLPWDRIAVLELVSAAALAVAVVVVAALLRRIGVGTILRMGED